MGPGEPVVPDEESWATVVRASLDRHGPAEGDQPCGVADDPLAEAILWAILGAEEEGRPLGADGLTEALARRPAEGPTDAAVVADRLLGLVRRRLVAVDEGRLYLTPAGSRQIGLRTSTGATREGPEHRALLLRAFRLFARRGCRMEIVRQGRYDTTLPDGLVRQLPEPIPQSPRELAEALTRAREGWAWGFFGGKDVHVEAEVSGALRAERVRRGVLKATRRGAFPLFVVADAPRAARVRRVLRAMRLGPRDAQVWTLAGRLGERAGPAGTEPTGERP